MDPLTAIALAISDVAKLMTVVLEGQPVALRAKGWERLERVIAALEAVGTLPPVKKGTK